MRTFEPIKLSYCLLQDFDPIKATFLLIAGFCFGAGVAGFITDKKIEEHKEKFQVSSDETQCIEEVLWYEARGESKLGLQAALSVVQNRKNSSAFPNSFCGVVTEAGQFSYRQGKPATTRFKYTPSESELGQAGYIRYLAAEAAGGRFESILDSNVLYFTGTNVHQDWLKSLKKSVRIDNHQFYSKR